MVCVSCGMSGKSKTPFWLFFAIFKLFHVTSCVCFPIRRPRIDPDPLCVCLLAHCLLIALLVLLCVIQFHSVVLDKFRSNTHTYTCTQSEHRPRQNQTRLHTNYMPEIRHNIGQWLTVETITECQLRVMCFHMCNFWFYYICY